MKYELDDYLSKQYDVSVPFLPELYEIRAKVYYADGKTKRLSALSSRAL